MLDGQPRTVPIITAMTDFKRVMRHLGGATKTAKSLGVSRAFVYQMLGGDRPVPPMLALKIERISGGKFRATDLNPKACLAA